MPTKQTQCFVEFTRRPPLGDPHPWADSATPAYSVMTRHRGSSVPTTVQPPAVRALATPHPPLSVATCPLQTRTRKQKDPICPGCADGDNWQSRLQQLESAVWGRSAEDSSVDGDSSDVAVDQDPPTFVTEQPASIAIPTPSRAQVDLADGILAAKEGETEEVAGGGKDANDGRDEGKNGAGIKRIRTMKSAARTVLVGVALCPKVETLQNQARFQKNI